MATSEEKPSIGHRLSASLDDSEAVEGSPFSNYISNLSPIKPDKSVHLSHSLQELNYTSPCVFASPKITSMNQPTALRRDQFSGSSELKFSPDVEESKASMTAKIVVECSHSNEAAPEVECDKVHSAIMHEDGGARSSMSCSEHSACSRDGCNSNGVTNLPIRQSSLVIEPYQHSDHIDNGSMSSITPSHNVKTESRVPISSILQSPEAEVPCVPSAVVQLVNIFDTCKGEPERQVSPDMHSYIVNTRIGNSIGDHSQMNDVEHVGNLADMVADDVGDFFVFSPPTQTEENLGQYGQTSNQSANLISSFVLKHSQIGTNGYNNTHDCGSLHSTYIHRGPDPGTGSMEPYGGKQDVDLTPQFPSTMSKTVINGDKIEKTDDRTICPDGCWIPLGCKIENQQLRGVRRRCLVFEPAEGLKENIEGNSVFNDASHPGKLSSDDKQMISCDIKFSSKRTLSGIGLHLNSLANPSLGGRVTNCEATISGNQVMSKTSCLSPRNPSCVNQKVIETTMDLKPTDSDSDISGDKTFAPHSTIVPTARFNNDMIEQSPRKRRRKATQSVEREGCKRCRCKKSKCLKLYCECFAAGIYCVQLCSCQGCLNKPEHEDTVIETRERIENRNPFAFAPKIMKPPELVLENKEEGSRISILARHKTGCNCKKSKCTKKYCECFQGGVACSSGCRCEGCTNAFGKKEGKWMMNNFPGAYGKLLLENSDCSPDQASEDLSKRSGEIEIKDWETRDTVEQAENLKAQEIQEDVNLSSECRSTTLPPLPSFARPPQSSRKSSCSALSNYRFLPSRVESEKHHMTTIMEDDTPEFLRVDQSPDNSVSVASPNRKRVSPPHVNAGSDLGLGSRRKLVLHPISSLQQVEIAP